ncbi:MAG TPA: type II secretion system F family protein [Noviherbaspirillum sp.]|uniref:type II secretion system F family protein n=1 Tax=Noviherbaspirillum sp. TaxID=1926288 RepID=UPI002B470F9D|nr:type II secretion system F family protein [Noviherbaspirillum sp.]HJV84034.1 type II secretion system F family protein [Noviherbaspirillum sp.]
MSIVQFLFLGAVFISAFAGVMFVISLVAPSPVQQRLRRHLNEVAPAGADPGTQWVARLARLSGPLAKLSVPSEGWEKSALRTRFMNAGFRGDSAPTVYFAAKTVLAIAIPSVLWLGLMASASAVPANRILFILVLASAIGFFLPNFGLTYIVNVRKREIFERFPEALDLLTICIEAGLAIDAAIARIAQEMAATSQILSEELHLVTLELRAGSAKEKALRNLAMRTGVEDIDSLVAMLIQAERFGTSVADSLRVHAESLRIKRRQRAEEAAAKVSLKLLFPLIFCFFPALLGVLMGPAFIQISRALLPAMAGH